METEFTEIKNCLFAHENRRELADYGKKHLKNIRKESRAFYEGDFPDMVSDVKECKKTDYRTLQESTEAYLRDNANLGELETQLLKKRLSEISKDKIKLTNYVDKIYNINTVTEDMKERALDYPIENLLDFSSNGKALCPFHDDTRASLHKYNNRGHCFVCNAQYDTIDIQRKLTGYSFIHAVKSLI